MDRQCSTFTIIISILLACIFFTSQSYAAVTVMQFADNTNPSPVFPSTINSTQFPVGGEVRTLDPMGNLAGGPVLKNLINGGEEWSFDMAGAMIGVMNTQQTPTSFLTGSACPAPCDGISQSFAFFGPLMGFAAPYVGSPPGNQYGTASLNITGANSFTVTFPVLEAVWAGAYLPLGLDNNQGVTLNCSGQPAGSFRCHGEDTIQVSEDPGLAGFSGWTVQFEFVSSAPPVTLAVSIDIAGGSPQECASLNGTAVALTADTTVPLADTIQSIDWTINGAPAGSGGTITPDLPLGINTVEVLVLTTGGDTVSDTTSVNIKDTTNPLLAVAFLDAQSGAVITSVSGNQQENVEVDVEASDVCDPSPQVSAHITPTYMTSDGEIIKIKPSKGKVKLPITDLSLEAMAEDASGNTTSGSAVLDIITGSGNGSGSDSGSD